MQPGDLQGVGKGALEAITKELPSEGINSLGSDRVEVMVKGVDVTTIKEVGTAKLGNMMDVMKVDQIGELDAGKKSEILKSSGANFLKLKPAEGTEATETTTSEIEWPDPEKIVEKPEFESLAKELETEAKSLLDNTVSAQALAALNRMRI